MAKVINIVIDSIVAILLIVFSVTIVASPTLGSEDFHVDYYEPEEVTYALQENLKVRTDFIAQETGILAEAFDYAVGPIKIDTEKNHIVYAIFHGSNYDYSHSSQIEDAYREGIREYYRSNGLEVDEAMLDLAVSNACVAFNDTFGVTNNAQLSQFVNATAKYSMIAAIVSLVLLVFFGTRIFVFNMGRTKSFAHLGSALVSAGMSLVTMFVMNLAVGFTDRLYLTNNSVINNAISQATGRYFLIVAAFGVAYIGLGITALNFVYNYYTKKNAATTQEAIINKKLLLENKSNNDLEF